MPHEVFISYSAKDKGAAELICTRLESAGIRCWMAPRDIRPGMSWGRAIIAAIDGARMVLLLFSQHANASPQVTREVERAVQKDLTIIPVRIENVAPAGDLEYFLGTPQWLDAMPLERHLDRILDSVKYWLPRGALTKITPIARTPLPSQSERGAQNPLPPPPYRPRRQLGRLIFKFATPIVLVGILSFLVVRQLTNSDGLPLPPPTPEAIVNWAAIHGRWNFESGRALFVGPPETDAPNWQFPHGLCLSAVQFSSGEAKVTIRFSREGAGIPIDSSGSLLLGYRSSPQSYLYAGLGDYNTAYSMSKFDPVLGWHNLITAGTKADLSPEHSYRVVVKVQGRNVSLVVDGISVLEYTMEDPLPNGQLGLFAWGTHPVVFTDMSANPAADRSGDDGSPSPTSGCPGLSPGLSLTCKLSTGQIVNGCSIPGAIPGPPGQPCHVGCQTGVLINQQ
jgi:hypothetical protein